MRLSVCILTHQRPKLFERCLQSVKLVVPEAEVIVNNDSDDIEPDQRALYLYNKGSLNSLYQSIFDTSSGSHIWFIEDDDVVLAKPTMHPGCMTLHRYITSDNKICMADIDHSDFQLSQAVIPRDKSFTC